MKPDLFKKMLPPTSNLTLLINIIIQKYFLSSNCLYLISDGNLTEINYHRPLLVHKYTNITQNLRNSLYRFNCQGFIVQTNKARRLFDDIEYVIRFTFSTKFQERRYLFVPLDDWDEYSDDLFESGKMGYVADVILVQPNRENGLYEFYTNKFIGEYNHTQPILLNVWFTSNGSFLHDETLYPDKFTDQNGRVLRISTFDYKPYINIDSQHGIELMMTKEYAKLRNLSTTIITETQFWGVMFDNNYTATGAKNTLLTDKCDVSLGSWYRLPNYTKYFDLTESTVRIGVTFIVPAPKLAGGWLVPLFSFSTPLWLGYICSYLILIVCFFLYDAFSVKFMSTNDKSIPYLFTRSVAVNTVLLFCQQSLNLVSGVNGIYLRNIMTVVVIISFFYASTYSAGFASVMTIPRYAKGVETSEELELSGLKWGAIHPALLDGFRDEAKYASIVTHIEILSGEGIRKEMNKQGYAMIVDRVPNGLVVADRIDYQDVKYYKVLKDDLYWDHCILLVKRSSVLIPSMRSAFLAMKEAGLVYYWEIQASFEDNFKAQQALQFNSDESGVVKLSWGHLQGAFAALWLGGVVGLVIFGYEHFAFKMNKNKLKPF